jgi:hypothetical protein
LLQPIKPWSELLGATSLKCQQELCQQDNHNPLIRRSLVYMQEKEMDKLREQENTDKNCQQYDSDVLKFVSLNWIAGK